MLSTFIGREQALLDLQELIGTARLVALTGAGGVIALVLVNGLVLLVRLTLHWPGSVPAWAVAAGLIVSIKVGLIFGVWPAMKAAKLDPVEALRYE